MDNFRLVIFSLSTALCLTSCHKKEKEEELDMEKHEQQMTETYVDTMVLHKVPFDKQIVCNGRLRAKAKSQLAFTTQGITNDIHVKEGQYVQKGALIASLDKREKTRELERAEHELERARVELTDKLIGLGYNTDLEGVPEEVMKRAEVTSGYYTAKYQLQSARNALEECNLYAPFSGRIASLEARPFQRNDKVCMLVDDSQFEVEFNILEAELTHVKKGQKVKVSPYVDDSLTFMGTVTEVNPMVDEKGLVKVMAVIGNPRNVKKNSVELMDGLNVRIVVEQRMQEMFVVPKDAVVERDGFHVIFRYVDGRAVWTYVDVVHSNISSYAITGSERKETTIQEGDIVITSGNLNLADGTEVKVN